MDLCGENLWCLIDLERERQHCHFAVWANRPRKRNAKSAKSCKTSLGSKSSVQYFLLEFIAMIEKVWMILFYLVSKQIQSWSLMSFHVKYISLYLILFHDLEAAIILGWMLENFQIVFIRAAFFIKHSTTSQNKVM